MNAVEIEEAISKLAEQPFDAVEFPFALRIVSRTLHPLAGPKARTEIVEARDRSSGRRCCRDGAIAQGSR